MTNGREKGYSRDVIAVLVSLRYVGVPVHVLLAHVLAVDVPGQVGARAGLLRRAVGLEDLPDPVPGLQAGDVGVLFRQGHHLKEKKTRYFFCHK